jgi:UDP-N-acetylmuramoylalanine--D-glutamate ligase
LLDNCELLIKNPGIRYDNVLVTAALDQNIPVWTDVELAYRISEASIIGITGTNGKTTTTTLISEILKEDGQSAKLAGNIGFPASEVAEKAVSADKLVMELSSFQLMGTVAFRPHIAVLTNLFSAHLDYHGSQEAYEAAKWKIQTQMKADDFLILNFGQEKLRTWADQTAATVVPFARDKVVDGAYSLDKKIYFHGEEVMEIAQLSLPGDHNLENALAAVAVAKLCAASNAAILQVLSHFAGVKHRLQYLGDIDGRKVYNDSKATNILATQKAMSGFDKKKLWLLAGGLDRGNAFDGLGDALQGLKGLLVFGETAPKLRQLADSLTIPVFESENVATALREVLPKSQPGDTILLSPACASWDQYKTFEERGDLFIATFEELKKKGAGK